ncbi:GNAT family N-acetyltransferase [Moritella viscosa]
MPTRNPMSLGICCAESGKLIGYAGIASISTLNRSGEYFILIGDKSYWGKGIGTEVTKVISDYGFNTLGLHRIELTAYANNPSAIRAYEKAGYVHEGVKKQSGFRNGEFVDKVMMAVLAPGW